jgi:hypothetical protein
VPTDTPQPTATATTVPTDTPQPDVTPSKTPDPLMPPNMSVLFEDDFADNSNHWAAPKGSSITVSVSQNAVHIAWPLRDLEEFYTPFTTLLDDFYFEADLSVGLPSNPAASTGMSIFNYSTWGVLFRSTDHGYYVVYVVPNTCTLGIAIYDASSQAYSSSGTTVKDCDDLGTKPKTKSAKLQIVASGNQFTVYVNGNQKAVFQDTTYTDKGAIGLFGVVAGGAGSQLKLNISRFVVGG